MKTSLVICLIDFEILGITESRLKEATSVTTKIILPGFSVEHIPTKPMEALYLTLQMTLVTNLHQILIEIKTENKNQSYKTYKISELELGVRDS